MAEQLPQQQNVENHLDAFLQAITFDLEDPSFEDPDDIEFIHLNDDDTNTDVDDPLPAVIPPDSFNWDPDTFNKYGMFIHTCYY